MIGLSNGMQFESDFHHEAGIMLPPPTGDDNIQTPSQVDTNKKLDDVEMNLLGGLPVSWKDNSEDFNNLPDDKYMQNIDKSPGFFLKDEMQQQPWKRYSDRAKSLTKQTYDLYKSGDTDTVGAVQNWESESLGRGYNDTDAGKQLKKEAIDSYGSKTSMSKSAIWETYMTHLQNLAGSDTEDEKIPDAMKEQLEGLSLFDRVGRPQIDLKPLWAARKFK